MKTKGTGGRNQNTVFTTNDAHSPSQPPPHSLPITNIVCTLSSGGIHLEGRMEVMTDRNCGTERGMRKRHPQTLATIYVFNK